MDQTTRNNRIVLIGGSLVAVVLIAAIGAAIALGGQSGPKEATVEPNKQESSVLESPFSDVSENFVVGYNAVAEPNEYAANTPYRIFGFDKLKLSTDLKNRLKRRLPEALATQLPPTFATSFIHIDRENMDCASEFNCRFNFYVDSPESYFSFRLYYDTDGSELYEIEQQPLPEERTS